MQIKFKMSCSEELNPVDVRKFMTSFGKSFLEKYALKLSPLWHRRLLLALWFCLELFCRRERVKTRHMGEKQEQKRSNWSTLNC